MAENAVARGDKMVHSQNKGKDFERECAKLLSAKLCVPFKRVPTSGAFSTIHNLSDSRFFGDLFTESEAYKDFVIECKTSKKIITLELLFSDKSIFSKWREQAVSESKGKIPVLIFRSHGSPIFLFTTPRGIPLAEKLSSKEPFLLLGGRLYLVDEVDENEEKIGSSNQVQEGQEHRGTLPANEGALQSPAERPAANATE